MALSPPPRASVSLTIASAAALRSDSQPATHEDKLLIAKGFPDPVTAKQERIASFKLHRRLSRDLLQTINQVVGYRPFFPSDRATRLRSGCFLISSSGISPCMASAIASEWSRVRSEAPQLGSNNGGSLPHARQQACFRRGRRRPRLIRLWPLTFQCRDHALVCFVNPLPDFTNLGRLVSEVTAPRIPPEPELRSF